MNHCSSLFYSFPKNYIAVWSIVWKVNFMWIEEYFEIED